MNCQVPLVLVAVFVKMGCQVAGNAKFVVAQIRVSVFARPSNLSVTLPFAFRVILVIKGVTTVSVAGALLVLP